MSAIILKEIAEKLMKKSEPVNLYGPWSNSALIISSLKRKQGLEHVATFYSSQPGTNEDRHIVYIEQGQLRCVTSDAGVNTNLELVIIDYATDLNKRNHGIINPSVLQKKNVTLIGLGSGGSTIGIDLIRAGVTGLTVIDFDIVDINNLCRSIYTLSDVGRYKTDAFIEKALSINPNADIRAYCKNIMEMGYEKLLEIIESSDLIIEATDSAKTKILVNGLAHNKKPVLYPSVYDLGKGGDVLFTMPGKPCFECVFRSILGQLKDIKKGDWNYSSGQAMPTPALIADIQVVAARAVKLALVILSQDSDNSFFEKVTEPECSILFIGNEKDVFVFDRPFQEAWARTEINPECSCQTLK